MNQTQGMSGTSSAAGQCDTAALNSLLRGELSAVETYNQAIEKFQDNPLQSQLRSIRDEHQQAVGTWRDQVRKFGGTPSDGSGPWGTFATAVTGAAKVIGPQTVLAALKQGEQHGINDYKSLLDNNDVNDECKTMVRSQFLPRCERHLGELDRMIATLESK